MADSSVSLERSSSLSASLQSQLLTYVTQISNYISGSFNKGFGLQGGVSASFGLHGGTWTEVADLIQGRNSIATVGGAAAGGLSSGQVLAVGGRCCNSVPYGSKCTELWDGEMGTWTEVNDLNEGNSFAVNVYSLYSSSSGVNPVGSLLAINASDLPLLLSLVLTLPFSSKLSYPGNGINVGSDPSELLIA